MGVFSLFVRIFYSLLYFISFSRDEDVDENVVTNNSSSHNRADGYDEQNDYLMRADGTILKKGDSNANGDTSVIDYKKGYVLRKCCYEPNGKRSEFYVCNNWRFINGSAFKIINAGRWLVLGVLCIVSLCRSDMSLAFHFTKNRLHLKQFLCFEGIHCSQ